MNANFFNFNTVFSFLIPIEQVFCKYRYIFIRTVYFNQSYDEQFFKESDCSIVHSSLVSQFYVLS